MRDGEGRCRGGDEAGNPCSGEEGPEKPAEMTSTKKLDKHWRDQRDPHAIRDAEKASENNEPAKVGKQEPQEVAGRHSENRALVEEKRGGPPDVADHETAENTGATDDGDKPGCGDGVRSTSHRESR